MQWCVLSSQIKRISFKPLVVFDFLEVMFHDGSTKYNDISTPVIVLCSFIGLGPDQTP